MTLLIYSSDKENAEERLSRVIGLLMPKEKGDICHSIDELSSRLRQPVFEQRVAILLIASRSELEAVITIRDLLEDTKVLLILPDVEPDTVDRGHQLHPRFICDYQSDFADVAAVLNMIMHRQAAPGADQTCHI